jgi:hypothetical protein
VTTRIELPATTATCDEVILSGGDQCQSYNGGGQEVNSNVQCTGDKTPFGCCTGSGTGTCAAGDAARCVETAMGTVDSDAADLVACAGVTSLADATACEEVMKASDNTAKACTYATSTAPRRWSSAPCQAAGRVGEGWTKEKCDAMATPALAEAVGAPCDTHPSYCFIGE